jgi:4-amino-4-deoxy-L-arabinose transferase-like glycosyltransferase
LNSLHFSQAVEGHQGNIFFYLKNLGFQYGRYNLILLVFGILLIGKIQETEKRIVLLAPILIVYIFFTIAQTKLRGYTMIVSPFVIMLVAFAVIQIFDHLFMTIRIRFWMLPVLIIWLISTWMRI